MPELELVIILWMGYLIVFRQMLRSSSVNQLNNVVAYSIKGLLPYLKMKCINEFKFITDSRNNSS